VKDAAPRHALHRGRHRSHPHLYRLRQLTSYANCGVSQFKQRIPFPLDFYGRHAAIRSLCGRDRAALSLSLYASDKIWPILWNRPAAIGLSLVVRSKDGRY
jgi:hypothetical protein